MSKRAQSPTSAGTAAEGRKPVQRREGKPTLACLFEAIADGCEVDVELRDESRVRGVVCDSDAHLNLWLRGAIMYKPRAQPRSFDEILVRSGSIRYVALPEDLDVARELEAWRKRQQEQSTRRRGMAAARKATADVPPGFLPEPIIANTFYGRDDEGEVVEGPRKGEIGYEDHPEQEEDDGDQRPQKPAEVYGGWGGYF
eukprot:m51a1_g10987 hypothetical protein (199) ;mRNA; f:321219-321879